MFFHVPGAKPNRSPFANARSTEDLDASQALTHIRRSLIHGISWVAVATTARKEPKASSASSLKAAKPSPNGKIPCGEMPNIACWLARSLTELYSSATTSYATYRIQDLQRRHFGTFIQSPTFLFLCGPMAYMVVIENINAAYLNLRRF